MEVGRTYYGDFGNNLAAPKYFVNSHQKSAGCCNTQKIFTDNCHVQITAAYYLATAIAEAVKRNIPNIKIRYDYSDGDIDWEEDFKIRDGPSAPAFYRRTVL